MPMADFPRERQEIADMCRRLSDQGYLAGTGGNIGLRLDEQLFAVTPTATDYATMQAEDVVILRLDSLAQVAGDKKPSVEKGLHQRMVRTRAFEPAADPALRVGIHHTDAVAAADQLSCEQKQSCGLACTALGVCESNDRHKAPDSCFRAVPGPSPAQC